MPFLRAPGRVADNTAHVPSGARRVLVRIACAVIAVAAAVPLGMSVNHELRVTAAIDKPSWIKPATADYRQEKCIYRAIRSELPQGTTIYISAPVQSTNPDPVLAEDLSARWAVPRLAEWSTLWAVPQPTPATARWMVSLAAEPGHCAGLALEVRRR